MTTLRQLFVALVTGSPLTTGQDRKTLYSERPPQEPRIIGDYDDMVIVKFDYGNYAGIEVMTEAEAKKAGYKDAR